MLPAEPTSVRAFCVDQNMTVDSVRSAPSLLHSKTSMVISVLVFIKPWYVHARLHTPSEQEPRFVPYLCGPGIWSLAQSMLSMHI